MRLLLDITTTAISLDYLQKWQLNSSSKKTSDLNSFIWKRLFQKPSSNKHFQFCILCVLTNLHSQTQNKASSNQQNTIHMQLQFTWKEFYLNLKLNLRWGN
ncbi:hypothetical protein ACB094_10G129600 [Castanea mollissima]